MLPNVRPHLDMDDKYETLRSKHNKKQHLLLFCHYMNTKMFSDGYLAVINSSFYCISNESLFSAPTLAGFVRREGNRGIF